MEQRSLGKTGLTVSTLGFGCGNVGGLMIRGTPADQERAVGHALALGITYYDTAPSYGAGESERNVGRVLRTLRAPVLVGTKFRVEPRDRGRAARPGRGRARAGAPAARGQGPLPRHHRPRRDGGAPPDHRRAGPR